MRRRGDRAVVLGGSMAGLMAAQVLADAYAEVVVVERDRLGVDHGPRRGVPQGRHIHALLARGQLALEELFDGLTAELTDGGVPSGDMLADSRQYFNGHRLRPCPSGLLALCASRPRLEEAIRARVRGRSGIEFIEESDVAGLAASAGQVTGARIFRRADSSPEETLSADLVVDATGRGSRSPVWLESLGYPRPPTEELRIGVGYASRRYRLTPGALDGALAVLVAATPAIPRGGALLSIEDGIHLVSLYGVLGDHPPTEPQAFEAFAATLPAADIAAALRSAEPQSDPVSYRFPTSIRHRYDRLPDLPAGLLVVGDAVASFNPIYGQGMTIAAMEALALRRHLERGDPQPDVFQREVARIVEPAWAMACGADLAFDEVEGRRTPATRLLGSYIGRLHAGATDDPELGRAFVRVSGLVDPPQALLRPAVVARVLRSSLRRSRPATPTQLQHVP